MTITNPTTGKPLKHYAQDDVTKERYIIISLQNDTDPNSCSVITYDNLDSTLRAELVAAVNSDEFQRVPEIWKLLDKKYFYDYPKQTMLNVLRALKQIKVVNQEQVFIELPGDVTMTPKEIVDAINQYESEKNGKIGRYKEPVASIENLKENDEIEDVKSRMNKLEENMNSLNSSLSELISVMKSQVTAKSE